MQQSNVNTCGHHNHKHTIRTSDGRTAVMCDRCHYGLMARLADKDFIGLMIKSTMTTGEVQRMGVELFDMAMESVREVATA